VWFRGTAYFFTTIFFVALVAIAPPAALAAQHSPSQSPSASPQPIAELAQSPVLAEQSGTWSATVYLNVTTVCSLSFSLVTSTPDDEVQGKPIPTPHCPPQPPSTGNTAIGNAATGKTATSVLLEFGSLPGVPEAATLVVTPSGTAAPLDITLTVDRQVTAWQYVWIPVICGSALGVLLILLTRFFGVPWHGFRSGNRPGEARRPGFWRTPLYAAAAWSFNDSWATNITAIATVVTAGLAATSGVAAVLPGVDLGRFSLLIAFAGGITVVAPLVFGTLNSWLQAVDPATTCMAEVWLSTGPVAVLRGGEPVAFGSDGRSYPLSAGGEQHPIDPKLIRKAALVDVDGTRGRSATISVPAGASVTVFGNATSGGGLALNSGATIDVPAGVLITVAPPADAVVGWRNVLTLPGTTDIVMAPGQRFTVSAEITLAGSAVASAPKPSLARRLRARRVPPSLRAGDWCMVPEGAKISFLGRATLTLPAGACIEAPVADPDRPSTRSVLRYQRGWALPRVGEVVAADMRSMLAAAFVTVFGIGAEIGLVGWSLGYGLAAAPLWARVGSLVISALAGLLVLGYGVAQIRALADPREGSALSGAGDSSFTL
jgi:hypothetical protein